MPQHVTIPTATLDQFARLADVLEQAGRLVRAISQRQRVTVDEMFWAECQELQQAFADLTEEQVNRLIDGTVQVVRRDKAASPSL